MTAQSVIIVGAGIVGVSCAIHLQRKGFDVTIIDRLPPGEGTSFGNAGVLAASSMIPVPVPGLLTQVPAMLTKRDRPLFLRWAYLPRLLPWLIPYLRSGSAKRVRQIAAGLAPIVTDAPDQHLAIARGTQAERWITDQDYVYVFRDRGDFDGSSLTWQIRRQHAPPLVEMDERALRDAVPGIGPNYRFAVRCTQHGTVTNPSAYVKDLADHVVAAGGRVLQADVADIEAPDSGPVTVTAGAETLSADRLVVAAGAHSDRVARLFGDHFPVEAERGYHIELRKPSITPPMPLMIADAKAVATPMADGLRVAGLVEFGGLDAGPSRAPFEVLLRAVRDLFPGITFEGHSEWMGHRPATPDSLPVIGTRKNRPAVAYAFGHHHVGLTGGPKTGRVLASLMAGEPTNLNVAPYAPDRFN